MDLHVKAWERLPQIKWQIPITKFETKLQKGYGTQIQIRDLFADIKRRIADGSFEGDLVRRLARTYNYFLGRVVDVSVNKKAVEPLDIRFGENTASETFSFGAVACAVMAGIAVPRGKFHVAENAGRYVFCNGRAVTFADKTALTGWGVSYHHFNRSIGRLLALYSSRLANQRSSHGQRPSRRSIKRPQFGSTR